MYILGKEIPQNKHKGYKLLDYACKHGEQGACFLR